MISLQKTISLPVISLESKQVIGYIKNFIIKNNHIKEFVVFSENEIVDTEFILPIKAVLCAEKDAVIVKNEDGLSVSENLSSKTVLGIKAYTQEGEYIGRVIDITCDLNFKIKSFVTETKEVDFSDIYCFENNVAILKGDYKVKIKKIPATEKANIFRKIELQNSGITLPLNTPFIGEVVTSSPPAEPLIPSKTIANNQLLLGKMITRNIEYNGKTIIKAGTVISQKILDLAFLSDTMKQVALNNK